MTLKFEKMFGSFRLNYSSGLAQIPLIIGLLLMAVAIPAATKLVQENNDTRNRAQEGGCGDPGACRSWERYEGGCCHSYSGCSNHSDCGGGKLCVDGTCQDAPTPKCDECSGGETCDGERYKSCEGGCWREHPDQNDKCKPKPTDPVATVPVAQPTKTRDQCIEECGGLESGSSSAYDSCLTKCMGTKSDGCTAGASECSGGQLKLCQTLPGVGTKWYSAACGGSGVCASATACATCAGVCTDGAQIGLGMSPGTGTCPSGQQCWVYGQYASCGGKQHGTRECYAGSGDDRGYNQCDNGSWHSYSCGSAQKCSGGVCVDIQLTQTPCVDSVCSNQCSDSGSLGGGKCGASGTCECINVTVTPSVSPSPGLVSSKIKDGNKCSVLPAWEPGSCENCDSGVSYLKDTVKYCGVRGAKLDDGVPCDLFLSDVTCSQCKNGYYLRDATKYCGSEPPKIKDGNKCSVLPAWEPGSCENCDSGVSYLKDTVKYCGVRGAKLDDGVPCDLFLSDVTCSQCKNDSHWSGGTKYCGPATKIKDGDKCEPFGVTAKSCAYCESGESHPRFMDVYCGPVPKIKIGDKCSAGPSTGLLAVADSCDFCEGGESHARFMDKYCGPTPKIKTGERCSAGPSTGLLAVADSCDFCEDGKSYSKETVKYCGERGAKLDDGVPCDLALSDVTCSQCKNGFHWGGIGNVTKYCGPDNSSDLGPCKGGVCKSICNTTDTPTGDKCSSQTVLSGRCCVSSEPTPDPRDMCGKWRSDSCSGATCSNGASCINNHANGSPCSCGVEPTPDPRDMCGKWRSDSCSGATCSNGASCINNHANGSPCSCGVEPTPIASGCYCLQGCENKDSCHIGTPMTGAMDCPMASCSGTTPVTTPGTTPGTTPNTTPGTTPGTTPQTTPSNPPSTTVPGPGPGSSCDYTSLQLRVQRSVTEAWTKSLTIAENETINVGCMFNNSGQLADQNKVRMMARYSDGTEAEVGKSIVSAWKPAKSGRVDLRCESTVSNCPLTSGGDGTTLIVTGGSACYECPSNFECYKKGTDYKWFVEGYTMTGYEKVTGETVAVKEAQCTTAGVAKPTFKGKAKADANCDGYANGYDYSIWRKEYIDKVKNSSRWEADFSCKGNTDYTDYSIWRRSSIDQHNDR